MLQHGLDDPVQEHPYRKMQGVIYILLAGVSNVLITRPVISCTEEVMLPGSWLRASSSPLCWALLARVEAPGCRLKASPAVLMNSSSFFMGH